MMIAVMVVVRWVCGQVDEVGMEVYVGCSGLAGAGGRGSGGAEASGDSLEE